MKPLNKVLILSGDISGNLGDRAIFLAICKEMRRANPLVKISAVSENRTAEKLSGACVIPKGPRGLVELLRTALGCDLILCGGGGLFQDDDSLVKMPYWGMRLALLSLFRKPIVGYSLGVGPLRSASGRLFARLAFTCMQTISVRDPEALKTSSGLTTKPIHLVPDPALLLPSASSAEAFCVLKESGAPLDGIPLVGVALRRWFHHAKTFIPHKYAYKYRLREARGRSECDRMTRLLAQALDAVVEKHAAHIVFMPTYNVRHEADDEICKDVLSKMRTDSKTLIRVESPRLYKAITKFFAVMLGARMHPLILAASTGTAIVGLSYNQKFKGLFDLLGVEDHLFQIEDFVANQRVDELTAVLSESIVNRPAFMSALSELVEKNRKFNAMAFAE